MWHCLTNAGIGLSYTKLFKNRKIILEVTRRHIGIFEFVCWYGQWRVSVKFDQKSSSKILLCQIFVTVEN